SKVVVAASRTNRQSGQECKWRSISTWTPGESFPSKYIQIKWIVSRQLIPGIPQVPRRRPWLVANRSAFVEPNRKRSAGLANLLNVIALGIEKRRPGQSVIPRSGNLY